nr:immunoglobulin heavy chain junction region [Mus musculus]MBK4184816.1 immunoglobulin heavy chain junction region [Mus musculus]MBK4184817.1 immunoglobulin heavy chain junction region [Mus musculus]
CAIAYGYPYYFDYW